MMHRTGDYKMLNMIFGILPFFAAILMTRMTEDSHPAHLWLSIVKSTVPSFIVLMSAHQTLDADATWFWQRGCSADDVQ